MSRFRNDTGSVLRSQEFGLIPPGEFDAVGYDPEVHGVIPGCTWLDAPQDGAGDDQAGDGPAEDTAAAADDGDAPRTTTRKRKGAGDEGKETHE